MLQNLIAKAALRVSPVVVAGETVYVKEPTYAEINAWRESIAAARTEDANAALFAACVVDEYGVPSLCMDDAYTLARGSMRVLNPLLAAITDALKDEAKNA